MKGVRELKSRIRGIGNIKKITKAMEMVATTKLRRLQDRALATRPYATRIAEMMQRVARHTDPALSPLLRVPETCEREALVVVGADRGLCGAYNSNLFRALGAHLRTLEAEGVEPRVFAFGRKVKTYLRKLPGVSVEYAHDGVIEKMGWTDARMVIEELSQRFREGEVQRVSVLYSRMLSLARFEPTVQTLLPVTAEAAGVGGGDEDEGGQDYILEPSPQILMERLLPRYLVMQLYAAVLESLTSEFAARRVAMKNATDNADELTEMLTMQYNKARQEGITNELMDIIGGTVALVG